jgi:hypothetical protein
MMKMECDSDTILHLIGKLFAGIQRHLFEKEA